MIGVSSRLCFPLEKKSLDQLWSSYSGSILLEYRRISQEMCAV